MNAPPSRPSSAAAASEEEALLWSQVQAGSTAAREALFSRYADFARALAVRSWRDRASGDIEIDDLRQLAYAGLLEALSRFEPERGVPFRAFAARRINGSLLDGIGKMSEVREQLAYRSRLRRTRVDSLQTDGADPASEGGTLAQLTEIVTGLALGFILDKGMMVVDDEADDRPNAYQSLAWRQTMRRVVVEVRALPDRERTLVELHYAQGVDFERIGQVLGVTKGRVSQLHKLAMQRLRAALNAIGSFVE